MLCLLLLLIPARGVPQALTQPLPLDASIRAGTLPNGLQYFIRKNGHPGKRASLRLAVNAGSIDETDTQRGLAHFLEHMAFNGTGHFKPGELVKYLESIGANFGADVNAYTSYDETVYMLEVPTDKEGLLDRGLVALSDFAGSMTLDPAEVNRERGVVIEEWRQRRGAGARVREQQAPAIYGASKYAQRDPIGLPEIIRTATPAQIRAFYEKWYRPDRMAVVVVGDVDPAEVQQRIVDRFSPLKKPAPPAPLRVYPIPPHAAARYAIVSDPETQQSSVSVIQKRPADPQNRLVDYRRSLVERLTSQMLNARFSEIARKPNAPFLGASAGEDVLGRTVEASVLSARVKDGAIATGLAALAQEEARVNQHGFGEAELERARKRVLASYDRMYNERNTAESPGLAAELIRHYFVGEPVPGIAKEVEYAKRFTPSITVKETADVARRMLSGTNRVVLAVAPQKAGSAAPNEAALRQALQSGSEGQVAVWQDDTGGGRPLMPTKPEPGSVRSSRQIASLGITVLTLSNGVEVWLKPTDFKNDQMLFTSYAKGGISLAPPSDFVDDDLAINLVDLGGVGGFTPVELEKMLPGKTAGASPHISPYSHGMSGSSSSGDLEVALQLMYLHFTAPNWSPDAFDLLRTRLQAALANREQSPGAAFAEKLEETNTMGHYTARPLRSADVPKLRADVMKAFYTARFANAADFTFFFAGSFTLDRITPLVARYVGSLPSHGAASSKLGDMKLQFPTDVRKETVRKGQEPKSQTVISFFADTGLDELEMHRLRAATSVLEMHLTDIIREEMGGTYGVNVGYSDTQPVPGYGLVQISFGSSPENADTLVAAVMKEVARLKTAGPSAEDIQKVKEIEKRGLETSARNNGYWVSSLQAVHAMGWDPTTIIRRPQRTESLTPENVHAAFRKYFSENRYTLLTLLPEKK